MADIRNVKTREAISEALITALKKQEFSEIRVENLCELARCSRSTFYSHFQNKNELAIAMIKQYLADFEQYCRKAFEEELDYDRFIDLVFEEIISPHREELYLLYPLEIEGLSLPKLYAEQTKALFLKYFPTIPSAETFSEMFAASVLVIFERMIENRLTANDRENLTKLRTKIWRVLSTFNK